PGPVPVPAPDGTFADVLRQSRPRRAGEHGGVPATGWFPAANRPALLGSQLVSTPPARLPRGVPGGLPERPGAGGHPPHRRGGPRGDRPERTPRLRSHPRARGSWRCGAPPAPHLRGAHRGVLRRVGTGRSARGARGRVYRHTPPRGRPRDAAVG